MIERFIWQVDPEGRHQLIHKKPHFEAKGSIATYRCPSIIDYEDCTLVIFSQYWNGLFPTEEVLKIDKETSKVIIRQVDEL